MLSLSPLTAQAQPSPDEPATVTTWEAPESCIQIEELRERVAAQIEAPDTHSRSLRGSAELDESSWRFTLIVDEGEQKLGERVFRLPGEACRDHDEAIILVAALLLEHGPPPPEEDVTPPPPVPAAPPPAIEEEPADPPVAPRSYSRFNVSLAGAVVGGWLPGAAWGPAASVGFRPLAALSLELDGAYFPERSAVTDSGEASMVATAARVGAFACGRLTRAPLTAAGCLGGGWIGLFAQGEGVLRPTRADLHTGQVSALLRGQLEVFPRLELFSALQIDAPFSSGKFAFSDQGNLVQVHETKPVLLGGRGGFTASF